MFRPAVRCPARVGIWRRHSSARLAADATRGSSGVPCHAALLRCHWLLQSTAQQRHPRTFATASYTVKGAANESEQVLFVVGINQGKFFGPDGAEEALKLLERVAEHDGNYNVLLGLPDRELEILEKEHAVKDRKLTPKSKIEHERYCEFIPITQAAMLDRRPRRALDRDLRVTQCHVAWHLWKNPREAIKVYWAWWRRNEYNNAECYRFWSTHFPISSHGSFNERAELISLRTIEQLIIDRVKRQNSTTVLVVRNDLFSLVVERMGVNLDDNAVDKMTSTEFSRNLQDRAAELCLKVPDLTSLLVFVYLGVPLFMLQHAYLAAEYYCKDALWQRWEVEESRE